VAVRSRAQERVVADADLRALLAGAYVEGGFTAPERAAVIFAAAAVRAGAAMGHARSAGARRMLPWTQTSMHAAQALSASAGFLPDPARDVEEGGRRFLFFASDL